MSKKTIAEGLNGLLATPAPETTQAPTVANTKPAATKQVTYNLNAELLERVRYVAFFSHKRNNAIVAEALEKFVTEWEQANGKIPVTL